MADLSTQSVDISKIKLRWEEPYVSEASNKQMSALPPGVYRGAQIAAMATPSQSFRVGPDCWGLGIHQDSLYVVGDPANGFGIIVIDAADVTFDMSARFTGGGSSMPSDETWWVFIEATYTTGSPSSATYKVTDTTPPDDAVIIGKIEMLSGDTTITNARIDWSVHTTPEPDKRKDGAYVAGDQWYGFLSGEEAWNIPTTDQKDALNAASSPDSANQFSTFADFLDKYVSQPKFEAISLDGTRTKFQINTRVYVENTAVGSDDFGRWIKVFPNTWDMDDGDLPLVGSDGGEITILRLLKDDGVTPLTVSDVDSDGYYYRPYVELDFSNTSDSSYASATIKCFYFARQTNFIAWHASPKSMLPFPSLQQRSHTNRIHGPFISGSPDTLPSGTLTSQLTSLLGDINDRVETINPVSSPSTPQLVWRSHNVSSDAGVTQTTTSVYVSNSGLFFIGGGFMDASGDVDANSGVELRMVWIGYDEVVFAVASYPGVAISPGTEASWHTYVRLDSTGGFVFNDQDTEFKGDVEFASSGSATFQGNATFNGSNTTFSNDVFVTGDLAITTGSLETSAGATSTFGGDVAFSGDVELTPGSFIDFTTSPDEPYPVARNDASSSMRPGVYFDIDDVWLVSNAVWNPSTNLWMPQETDSDANAICISSYGIKFFGMSHDEVGYSSGWTKTSGWNRTSYWGIPAIDKEADSTYSYNCLMNLGDFYEQCRFAVGGRSEDGGQACYAYQGVNFRSRYSSTPSNIDYLSPLDEVLNPGDDGLGGYALYFNNADKWGVHVKGISKASMSAGDQFYYQGTLEIFT